MEQEEDWGSVLPRSWWIEVAKDLAVNPQMARFAAGKHGGLSNSEAARRAGYGGAGGKAAKTEGYRLLRSNGVQRLLAMAVAESGTGFDGAVSAAEARSILSTLARGSDPRVRIDAIGALAKIDERAKAEKALQPEMSAEDLMREILGIGTVGGLVALGLYEDMVGQTGPRLDLTGIPLIRETAPALSKLYPDLWDGLRGQLDAECRADLDRFAAGREIPLEVLAARPARRSAGSNGSGEEVSDAGD